jgi:hypothetical protein
MKNKLKRCCICNIKKPLSDFYKESQNSDCLRGNCKECDKKRHQKYHSKITYCCQDCGNKISSISALKGKGRCGSCSHKGINNPFFGKHHNNKFKKLISKIHKGKINSKETRRKISIGNKGKIVSFETRKKQGKIRKGRKHSEETKIKIGLGNKDKIISQEQRQKSSEAQLREKHWNWRGGISFLPYSLEFTKELKLKIRCRDEHKCQKCGITEERYVEKFNKLLSIHHIDYNKLNCKENNLITTCGNCNSIVNFNRDYWYAYFRYILDNENK